MQMMYVIIELMLPSRNFLLIYLWYNYLTMRYMQDRNGCLKEALAAMDMQIMTLLSNRYGAVSLLCCALLCFDVLCCGIFLAV